MNNVRFNVTVAVWAAFAASLHAQDVRCEKYKLDNGMTVILHQDRSLPVGAINIWYRVGSKDEPARRSGFAHLFEHLMFMGTERVPGSDFDTIMEAGGGANNATTSTDRTNYFSSGPSSLLPTLLWLDADRLEDLGRTTNQEKLDKQRDVVRNERRQSYENRPYGKADLLVTELLYPPGHPYHIPVIGTHEDLEAATVADVKDFFAAYYVPNNASLCVAGDFDPAVIKPLIAELFGTIPRGQEPDRRTAAPVRMDGVKRATVLDKVQLPMVSISYHSPPTLAEGDAEMDLVAAILTEGKTSRLYKRLIYDDKIAAEVSAGQWSRQLSSVFQIEILANPGVALERIEKAVDEEIARFVDEGPTAGELEQRKATIERRMLENMETIEARADQLNLYEYHWGEPNSFKRDLDRYRNATADGVKSWAKRVLTPDARVIIRVLPETPERSASARDARPGPAGSPNFKPPTPETFKLANGIPVMLWTKKELPLVETMVIFRTGEVLGETSSAGAVHLAAAMMDEGAGDRDALQFGDALQSLGADFSTSADHESVRASLAVLKRNFDTAAGLMADALRRPRFDEADWQRVKRLHLEELKKQEDQPVIVGSRVAARVFFGEGHPYALPAVGLPETVEKLSLEDVRGRYRALVRPENMTLLIAGDLTPGEAKSTLDRLFGDWKAEGKVDSKPREVSAPRRDALEVVLVNRPEAVQTVVHFMMPGPHYADPARVTYRLVNTILGGSFTSRLNMNLREEHGYTYGARSRFTMLPKVGYVTASSSVRADVTGESLKEFLKELNAIRGGTITEEESRKSSETLRTDVIQSFAGLGGILSEAAERLIGGLPFESLEADMAAMRGANAASLNSLAKNAIPYDRGVLVLVGDRDSILAQLEGLNLPRPTERTARGDRTGS